MNILVTGGGGFLGSYIVKKLLEKGHHVTSFSRNSHPLLEKLKVKTIKGDLKDPISIRTALKDIEVVFHVASKISMWGKWSDFYQVNFLGTKYLIDIAKEMGVKKFIYTSTPSVAFGKEDLKGADETIPYPKEYLSLYARSKALAEEYVLKANEEGKFLTTSLRPHLIFGPGDNNLIPKIVEAHKKKKLKRIGNGKNLVDVIYVENAADAHILALEALERNPKLGGEAYFIGQDKPVKLWDFIDEIMKVHDLNPVKRSIPFPLAYTMGALMEKSFSAIKRYDSDPPMTRFVAMQLAKSHYFDHTKAKNNLNFNPKISIEEGLTRLRSSDSI